jgi:hypothetical protein
LHVLWEAERRFREGVELGELFAREDNAQGLNVVVELTEPPPGAKG